MHVSGAEYDLQGLPPPANVELASRPVFYLRVPPIFRLRQLLIRLYRYRGVSPHLGRDDALIRGLRTASNRAELQNESLGIYTCRSRLGFRFSLSGNSRTVCSDLLFGIRTECKRIHRNIRFGNGSYPGTQVNNIRNKRFIDSACPVNGHKLRRYRCVLGLYGKNHTQAHTRTCIS